MPGHDVSSGSSAATLLDAESSKGIVANEGVDSVVNEGEETRSVKPPDGD